MASLPAELSPSLRKKTNRSDHHIFLLGFQEQNQRPAVTQLLLDFKVAMREHALLLSSP
jgi:hypothetical protein